MDIATGDGLAPHGIARVGTAGWSKPSWKTHFHPAELRPARALEYTAARLVTIELNTTFHGLRSASDFRGWHERTPEGFVFAVKGHRPVTLDRRAWNREQRLADFFGSGVLHLRNKLGPIMWQFDETHEFDAGYVEAFLAALPRTVAEVRALLGRRAEGAGDAVPGEAVPGEAVPGDGVPRTDLPIRYAIEARHASFALPAFHDLLAAHDVAAVLNTAPGRPGIDPSTSDFVYLRLHGSAEHNPDGYDDAALDRWAERIRGWTDGSGCPDGRPRDVFAYFTNRDGWHPPFDAVRLQQRLDGAPDPDAPAGAPGALW